MAKAKKTTTKRATKTAKPKVKAAAKPKAKRKSGLTQTPYTVSPELQEIVGAKKLTRPEIVKKLWAYIKAKKCQDTKNRRMINPDQKLSEVIGKKPVDMLKLAGCLNKHIQK
ncbi:MAG: SWIB/MDM2 domain-containing protein [Chlamydiales bacterium]|nr:SWIB/MDM2 domain-containing protein [Chlamydiales bacterium]